MRVRYTSHIFLRISNEICYGRILRMQYRAVVAALLTANNDPAINEIRNGSVHKIEGRIYIHNSFLFILFPRRV